MLSLGRICHLKVLYNEEEGHRTQLERNSKSAICTRPHFSMQTTQATGTAILGLLIHIADTYAKYLSGVANRTMVALLSGAALRGPDTRLSRSYSSNCGSMRSITDMTLFARHTIIRSHVYSAPASRVRQCQGLAHQGVKARCEVV